MTDPLDIIEAIADAAGGDDNWLNTEISDNEIEEEWDDGDDSFYDTGGFDI